MSGVSQAPQGSSDWAATEDKVSKPALPHLAKHTGCPEVCLTPVAVPELEALLTLDTGKPCRGHSLLLKPGVSACSA